MQNKIITIWGSKGTGKTTKIKSLIADHNKTKPGVPVFIFDYVLEYKYNNSCIIYAFSSIDKNKDTFHTINTENEAKQHYLTFVEALKVFKKFDYFILRIRMEGKSLKKEIDKIVYAIMEIPIKCLFVFDEMSALCAPNSISDNLGIYIRTARHYENDLIMATQRPPDTHILTRSQSDYIYIFNFIEPNDLNFIKKITTKCDPAKLKIHECFIFSRYEKGK